MKASDPSRRRLADPELVDQVDLLVEVVRATGRRWRARADAGRLGAHPIDEVLRLVEVLDGVARELGEAVGAASPHDAHAAPARARERLARGEERFRLLVDAVQEYAIYLLDPDGRITTWNAGAERLTGYAAEEILGHDGSVFYPREDVAAGKPRRVLELAARDGRFEEESWRVRKDGRLFWADVVMTAVREPGGALRGFAKVVRDATDRKRAEDARRFLHDATVLLASALELRQTLDDVARLVVPRMADWCLVDLLEDDGAIHQVATAHADPAKAPMVRELARRRAVPPELAPGVAHVIRSGRAEIHPDVADAASVGELVGAAHPAALRELGARSFLCAPLVARGRVFGAITFVRAAEGHRYDDDDRRDAEELGRRAGLSIDNARLYEQAQAAVQVRDEFLAIAAHELRTPVMTLQLGIDNLEGLARDAGDGAGARAGATLDALGRQVARLAGLVETILDVSRLAAGRLELEPEEVDLAALVRDVVAQHEALARLAGSELRTRLAPARGRWDRARLARVVVNLLANAIKYGAGKPIEIEVEQAGDTARLWIRDQGIGLDPARAAAIFDRFERAVSARSYGGLGLGLYVAREIVESHGGRITAAGAPGAGATFVVELPARPPAGEGR